ncbi:hypothetical protein F8568_036980 [Actinomadura sp. LD22]|uniref:Integral membrane protein n=1 Tax=Actinomadura physcomitrii TaxID=2650748 RepID=A0A6I4MU73_9ACTN|nr:hypothetical protein [Actinomadura physcomitrii]MWA05856.1 hypothetical protein [Actinomadura physcomitrii]
MTEPPAAGATEPAVADQGMRLLRAAAFSVVCVSVSGCAHASASGAGLSWWSVLAGWLLTLCLVTPLAGRERSRPGIIAALLCGQLLLHVLFALGQCHGAGPEPGASPSAMPAMPAHGAGMNMGPSLMPGPTMFAAHLVAAALLGWLLHHGDRALWSLERVSRRVTGVLSGPLARLLDAALLRLPALPLPPMRPHARGAEARGKPDQIVLLHHAVIRRGPPMGVSRRATYGRPDRPVLSPSA